MTNNSLEGYTDTNKRFASYEIRKKDTERALVKVLDGNREIYLHYNINDYENSRRNKSGTQPKSI